MPCLKSWLHRATTSSAFFSAPPARTTSAATSSGSSSSSPTPLSSPRADRYQHHVPSERERVRGGNRIRFTGSDKDLGVRRGEFGTIERIGEAQDLIVRTDAGKRVEIAPSTARQFEQGYVVSDLKGMSPDRVLVSEEITTRLGPFSEGYQAISCASQDVVIYTPHSAKLYEHPQRQTQGEKNEQSSQAEQSKGSSLTEMPGQWFKDYKAALSLDEEIKPVPLSGSLLDRAKTLALDSEPARVKRIVDALTPGESESTSENGIGPSQAPAQDISRRTLDPATPSKTEEVRPAIKEPVFDRSLGLGL